MVSVIFTMVAMELWIGAVAGLAGTPKATVYVVALYFSAAVERSRWLWSPPLSGVKTDGMFQLILVRAIWMIWKVGSVVL